MSLVDRAVKGARPTVLAPPVAGDVALRIIQAVGAGDQGQVSHVDQAVGVTVHVDYPELFVHLSVVETEGSGALMMPGSAVRAGACYRVRAAATVNRHVCRTGESASPSVVQTGIRLARPLVPIPDPGPGLEAVLPPGECPPITLGSWEEWSYDFEIVVTQDVCEETVSVGLALREGGTDVVHAVVRLSFAVEGACRLPPAPIRSVLPPGPRPPAGTAFLYVVPYDGERLRFLGWVAESLVPALKVQPIRAPRLKMHEDGSAYRRGLAEAMHDFVLDEGAPLAAWLAGVVEASGDECCIVVMDKDPAQAPWEMMTLPTHGMLGAQVRVVRWTDLQYRGMKVNIPVDEVTYAGRVAALVDRGNPPPWAGEYLAGETWVECDDLVNSLLDQPRQLAVVYLSSRGLFVHGDEDGDTLTQLLNSHGTKRLRFDDLEETLEPRPLVLSDAPFSARLLFCGERACGMAHAVMQRLAAGLVGTLGPVDRDYAMETARLFLVGALSDEGVCPAELLRERRAAAAAEWGAAKGPERERVKRRLLNASMFVFYGGPRVRVRILSLTRGGDG